MLKYSLLKNRLGNLENVSQAHKAHDAEKNHTNPEMSSSIDCKDWAKNMEQGEECLGQFLGVDNVLLSYVVKKSLDSRLLQLTHQKFPTLDKEMIAHAPTWVLNTAGMFFG